MAGDRAQSKQDLNALLEVIESLQGSSIAASILETDILPARLPGYSGSELDTLTAAGEVVWIGLEPLGNGTDGWPFISWTAFRFSIDLSSATCLSPKRRRGSSSMFDRAEHPSFRQSTPASATAFRTIP